MDETNHRFPCIHGTGQQRWAARAPTATHMINLVIPKQTEEKEKVAPPCQG